MDPRAAARTHRVAHRAAGRPPLDPADRVTLDESVNMAFLVVLESMTPAERVAFILHDVFRYSFAEVAEIVGRTPAACRQLASSARRRIRAAQAPATPTAQQAEIVRDFKRAWEAKDINALIGLLDPDATAIADGGGLAMTFLRPIEGGEQIARAWSNRQPGDEQHDVPGAHGQRPARSGGSAGRRHRDGVRVRRRRRPDQAHLGGTQPREAPSLDDELTRAARTGPWPLSPWRHADPAPSGSRGFDTDRSITAQPVSRCHLRRRSVARCPALAPGSPGGVQHS